MTDNLITISKSAYESLQQELIELRQMSVRNQCTKSSANPEHISLFIEHAPAAIAILDKQMRYLLASRRWRQAHGLEDEEIIGRSHYDIFPNVSQRWREIYQRCLVGAIEKSEEDVFYRHDGTVDWVKWEIHPWYSNSGEIGGLVMFTEVITHRKQAEIALESSERFLKDIADNLLVGAIFQVANFNGVWRADYMSDFIWQLAGITAAEMMQDFNSFIARVHPEDLDSYNASVAELLANPAPWHYEGRLIKPNGEIRWWQADSTPTKNQQGEIIFRGVLMDITERKQAEQALKRLNEELEAKIEERTAALRQNEVRFQKLSDNVPGMLYEFCLSPDGSTSLPYASSGLRDIVGLELEQVQTDAATSIFAYTHPDDFDGLQAAVIHSAQTLENFKHEWRVQTPSGQEKLVQAISRPERQPGGEIVWYGCMIDVSDRQQVEKERQMLVSLLRQSEARFQKLADNVPGMIYEFCLHPDGAMSFPYVSSSSRLVLGIEPEQMRADGTLAFTYVYPDDLAGMQAAIIHSAQTLENFKYQWCSKTPSGQDKWLESVARPERQPGGETIWYGCTIDISDRHQAEKERQMLVALLRQSEARFQKLADSVPGMLYEFCLHPDGAMSFPYVSSGAREILGLEPEQMQADAAIGFAYVHPDDRSALYAATIHSMQTLETFQYEWRIKTPSGQEKWIQSVARPERQPGGEVISYGCLIDISDRQQAQQQKQMFASLIENSSDFIGLADLKGKPLYINEAGLKLVGIENLEIAKSFSILDYIYSEDREDAQQRVHPAVIENGIWKGEYRFQDFQTQEPIPVDYNVFTIKNHETGEPLCLATITRDIRDRKQAEAKLQEQEQFLRSIYDGVSQIIFVVDVLENGKFIYADCNSALEKNLGINHADIVGKTPIEFHGAIEGTAVVRDYQNCVDTGNSASYEECFTFNGAETWWLTNINPLKNNEGKIYRLVGSTLNITERKQAETALQASQHFIQRIADSSPNILYIFDLQEQRNVYANRELVSLLDYSTETIQQMGANMLPKIAHPDDLDNIIRHQQTLLNANDGDILEFEFRVKRRNGEWCWLYTRETPFNRDPNGKVKQILGVSTDITARKNAELKLQQQAESLEQTLLELQQTQSQLIHSEKMSSLGNMVAGVAHEINNPVNFIHGNLIPASEYTEDLLRLVELYQQYFPHPPEEIQAEIAAIDLEFVKEDLIKLLQSMRVGTQRIREIVLSLRNFSRLDEAEFKQVDIHEGIDSTLMILHNRLKCKPDHPEILVMKEYGDLPLVECYPGQLNQVFMNILSNAIDALDETYTGQQGQIIIRTETLNNDRIAIKISDNGVGIPQHAISKLFDPFFTTKDVGKGTGLGLSISYQIIVDKHRGKLSCHSAPQQGAEFIIEIPITQSKKYT